MSSSPFSKKSEADQAGILVWGKVLADAAGAITPIVVVRLLSQAEVGQWASVMVVYQTVGLLFSGGFPRVVLYALAGRPDEERKATAHRLLRLMFILGAVVALSLFAAGLLGQGAPDPSALHYLPYIALYALFDMPLRLMPNLMLAEGRARISAGISVTRSLGATIAVIVPSAVGLGVPGVLLGTVLVGALHLGAFLIMVHGLYPDAKGRGGMSTRELVRFGAPLGLTEIAAALNQRLDMWLVILFLPVAAAAEYKVGAWQLPLVATMAYSTGSSYLPRLTRLFAAGRAAEAIEVWHGTIRKLALVAIPMGTAFMVGAEDFVTAAFGPDYARAAWVLRAYAFITAGRVAAFGPVLVAAGRPGYLAAAAVFTLLSNLAVSWPLVATLGFVGPALGTALAFIPMVAFYCAAIARASQRPLWGIFPLVSLVRVIAAALPGIAFALAIETWAGLPPIPAFVAIALTVFGVFGLVGTVSGLITREDWRFVGRWAGLSIFR